MPIFLFFCFFDIFFNIFKTLYKLLNTPRLIFEPIFSYISPKFLPEKKKYIWYYFDTFKRLKFGEIFAHMLQIKSVIRFTYIDSLYSEWKCYTGLVCWKKKKKNWIKLIEIIIEILELFRKHPQTAESLDGKVLPISL